MLPTAKNRSTKSVPRDGAQCVYFDVFMTYARHKPLGAQDYYELKAAIKSATTNGTSQRSCSKNRLSQLHSEVSSWNTKRQKIPSSSTIFNESIGEDGLSSVSTYDVRIDNPHHIECIAPNPKVLIDSQPTNDLMKNYYQILVKAMNDMRIQASSNDTLSAIDHNGRTFNTHIAEMHAEKVCLNIDDVKFYEWALENKSARLWYCQDLHNSELLKLGIENAINRSPHDSVQRCLFQNEKDKQRNQFVGFVSSHTTGKIIDSFHLHSFVVFHTINGEDTIVTCIVTARNHILSNMQDCVLQLMQLIQYRNYSTFSTSITNHFIGVDVQLSKLSLNGYEAMGFDVRSLTQDRDQDQFTITTQTPIPLAIYDDHYTWAKYGRLIIPQGLKLNEKQYSSIRSMYRTVLQDFLRVDLEGNISNTLDVSTKSKLNEYLSSVFKGLSETATTEITFDEYLNTAEKKGTDIRKIIGICLQQAFLFPYSPIYFTRGSRSMLIWNQHWKFCSSSISRCIRITNIIL